MILMQLFESDSLPAQKSWYDTNTGTYHKVPFEKTHTKYAIDNFPNVAKIFSHINIDTASDDRVYEYCFNAGYIRVTIVNGYSLVINGFKDDIKHVQKIVKDYYNAGKIDSVIIEFVGEEYEFIRLLDDESIGRFIRYRREPRRRVREGATYLKSRAKPYGTWRKPLVTESISDDIKLWYHIPTRKMYTIPNKIHHSQWLIRNGYYEGDEFKVYDVSVVPKALSDGWVRIRYYAPVQQGFSELNINAHDTNHIRKAWKSIIKEMKPLDIAVVYFDIETAKNTVFRGARVMAQASRWLSTSVKPLVDQ